MSADSLHCEFCHDRWRDASDDDEDYPPRSERQLQLCSGCRKVYYCCRNHQKSDWIQHVFHCKPNSVTTAHHLLLAVRRDLIPDHPQTRIDYGFERALPNIEQNKLFGLYVGFIQIIPHLLHTEEVTAKRLHNWRVKGLLVEEIKKAFEALPPQSRGGYYPWFLQNQHVLAGPNQPVANPAHNQELKDLIDTARRRAWIYSGGSPNDTTDQIDKKLNEMRESENRERETCITFISALFTKLHPGPDIETWITFGLCACRNQHGEMRLAGMYLRLFERCSFDEFYEAFMKGGISGLLQRKEVDNPLIGNELTDFEDVIKGTPTGNKTVWNLKAFIVAYKKNIKELTLGASVDYGFLLNCKTAADTNALLQAYRRYFDSRDCRPLQLHEACVQGRLYDYVNSVVRLDDEKLRRLMKNLNPLPDPDD